MIWAVAFAFAFLAVGFVVLLKIAAAEAREEELLRVWRKERRVPKISAKRAELEVVKFDVDE